MLSNIIIRSAAAFGGAPFRLNKCTALGSATGGANGGEADAGLLIGYKCDGGLEAEALEGAPVLEQEVPGGHQHGDGAEYLRSETART